MAMLRTSLIAGTVALLGFAGTASLSSPRSWQTSDSIAFASTPEFHAVTQSSGESDAQLTEHCLASHIIGTTIENADGEKLGTVRDLVVDTISRLQFVILSPKKFWAVGRRFKVVPL